MASSGMVHAGDAEIRVIDPNAASGLIAAARRNGDRLAFPPLSGFIRFSTKSLGLLG